MAERGQFVLYRLYDTAGELLYVGATNNLDRRLRQHGSYGIDQSRTTTEVYPCACSLSRAEAHAGQGSRNMRPGGYPYPADCCVIIGCEPPPKWQLQQTHCDRGHPLSPENTYPANRSNPCLHCRRKSGYLGWVETPQPPEQFGLWYSVPVSGTGMRNVRRFDRAPWSAAEWGTFGDVEGRVKRALWYATVTPAIRVVCELSSNSQSLSVVCHDRAETEVALGVFPTCELAQQAVEQYLESQAHEYYARNEAS